MTDIKFLFFLAGQLIGPCAKAKKCAIVSYINNSKVNINSPYEAFHIGGPFIEASLAVALCLLPYVNCHALVPFFVPWKLAKFVFCF